MYLLRYLAFCSAVAPVSLAAQEPVPVGQPAGGYAVDFENQSLQVVLSALAQAAGVNVTFSRLPDIRTTLRLGQPVPKEELVEIMRHVAEGNGLVMRQTGSLILISQPDGSEERRWFREASPPDVRIYTYRLKHNSAVELAPVLMNVFSGTSVGRPTDSGGRRNREGGRGGNEGGGSRGGDNGGGIGASNGNDSVASLIPQAARLEAYAQRIRQQNPNGADASRLMALAERFRQQAAVGGSGDNGWRRGNSATGGGRSQQSQQSQVRIVAEEYTNTLLVRATPEEWEWIKKIIEEVD